MEGSQKTEMESSQKTLSLAENLPEEVLKLIFSFLCLKDLLNVQKVCTTWAYITMDTLLWKYASLTINQQKLKKLGSAPYIHTIKGFYRNGDELLNSVVTNVIDLRRMDCSMVKYSAEIFEKFVMKFKNLESLKMFNTAPEFVKCLELLSANTNIKDLFLHFKVFSTNFTHFTQVINNGFSSLKRFHVVSGSVHRGVKESLSDIVKNKINQLTYLFIGITYVHMDVWKLIFQSQKLETLRICIYECPEVPLNLGSMTNLKQLYLTFSLSSSFTTDQLTDVYNNIVFPPNLECFRVNSNKVSKPGAGLISKVISSLTHLKEIGTAGYDDADLNEQLENISNLSDLHTVQFYRCTSLSSKGAEYIMQCTGLRRLSLSGVSFRVSTFQYLRQLTYLKCLELFSCTLNPENLLETILEMKYLTQIFLVSCLFESEDQNWLLSKQCIVNKILAECKEQKHYVKIDCS